jgi:hypothetical protein
MYVTSLIALTIHYHSGNATMGTLQRIRNDLNLIYLNYVCFISVIDIPNSYHFPSRVDHLCIITSRLQSAYFHSLSRGSLLVKALDYKPKGRGLETRRD